jgi:prophage regulatory protein
MPKNRKQLLASVAVPLPPLATKIPVAAVSFCQISKSKKPVAQPASDKSALTQSKLSADQFASPSRFVFKPEVLDRVGVSYVSLWQWMREGKFPCSREVGGKVAWLESEIDEWIATRPLRKYKNVEAM